MVGLGEHHRNAQRACRKAADLFASIQEVCGLMVASLGTVELAVNSVLLSFSSILFQFPLSGGNAAANRIGNLLGANRPAEASLASKVALALAVFVSMFNRSVTKLENHSL